MSITKLWALVQLRLGPHALPIEQGRIARPALSCHLRRCSLGDTQAVGDELYCPHFIEKDQKSVTRCLIALLRRAQTKTHCRPHKPGWLYGRHGNLSFSLSLLPTGP